MSFIPTQCVTEDGDSEALAAHEGDGTDAHNASAISFVPTGAIAADDVQEALEELDTEKVSAATLLASGKGFVNHGAVAGTARPTGYASIEWFGSVEPTNAIDGDTWIDTSA